MPGSVELLVRCALAAILVWSAGAKLARPRESRQALDALGIGAAPPRTVAWASLIATELALAAGVAAGLDVAAYVAAGLMAGFAAALTGAILAGRAGRPCGCFGARSRVGWFAVARNLLLAAGFAAVPWLSDLSLSADTWLAVGLGISLAACLMLAVAVLALYREIGLLRMRWGPGAALEIPEEGPELGGATGLIERFQPKPGAELALAVFVSDGCHVCHGLEPAIETLARDPVLSVRTFEEAGDAAAWREADVPGSPFAVVVGLDGTVLAKGTFNNLAQLEGMLGTAERRRAAVAAGEAIGV